MNPLLILGLGVLVFGVLIPASVKDAFDGDTAWTCTKGTCTKFANGDWSWERDRVLSIYSVPPSNVNALTLVRTSPTNDYWVYAP